MRRKEHLCFKVLIAEATEPCKSWAVPGKPECLDSGGCGLQPHFPIYVCVSSNFHFFKTAYSFAPSGPLCSCDELNLAFFISWIIEVLWHKAQAWCWYWSLFSHGGIKRSPLRAEITRGIIAQCLFIMAIYCYACRKHILPDIVPHFCPVVFTIAFFL